MEGDELLALLTDLARELARRRDNQSAHATTGRPASGHEALNRWQ